jgi:hypothetical protein
MKQMVVGLLVGALCVLAGVAAMSTLGANGGAARGRHTLTVLGTGTVRVPADTVRITFTVTSEGSTLAEARQKSKELVKQITADLDGLLNKHKPAWKRVTHTTAYEFQPVPPVVDDGTPGKEKKSDPKPKVTPGGSGAFNPFDDGTPGPTAFVDVLFTIDTGVKALADSAPLHKIVSDVKDMAERYPLRRDRRYAVETEYARRDVVAARREALKAARAAAVADAEALAGPGAAVEVIDITEQGAVPMGDPGPMPPPRGKTPGDPGPILNPDVNEPGPLAWSEGPGNRGPMHMPGQENEPASATSTHFEITVVVIVKCVY